MKFKKAVLILTGVFVMTAFCGCDLFASINLTEEQSGLIAEYAAGILRKYDTNGKLKDLAEENETASEELEEEEIPEETPDEMPVGTIEGSDEILPDGTESSEEPDFYDITEGMEVVDAVSDVPEIGEADITGSSISDLLGVQGFDISYAGYALYDQYPDNADNSWLISMAAREGKKLCVVSFVISNETESDAVCDILNSGKSYRLIVNDDKKINETVTVLMDSFSQFNETVAAGESREAVLIFEPDNELAESINTLKLIIKDKDNSNTVSLE